MAWSQAESVGGTTRLGNSGKRKGIHAIITSQMQREEDENALLRKSTKCFPKIWQEFSHKAQESLKKSILDRQEQSQIQLLDSYL